MIKPIFVGGLGLASLELRIWACLAKWWWRFGAKRDALWRKVVVSKYGEDGGGWSPSKVPRYWVSNLSGSILRVGDKSHICGAYFIKG